MTTAIPNSIVTGEFEILHLTQAMRNQLMDMLTDADLAYALPGSMTLGELCANSGQVQQSYIDSLRTFEQSFDYAPVEPGVAISVERLKGWFAKLDRDMDDAFAAIPEEQVQTREIDRGGHTMPVRVQLHCYREGMLIFYGRATLYLNALGKEWSGQMKSWIG